MYFTTPTVRTTRHISGYATVRGSLHRQAEEQAPMRRIAQFLGKAQAAMMRAISFNCRSNHDVVSGMIQSKNRLKARLRAAGETDVSEDERPPMLLLLTLASTFLPVRSGRTSSLAI